jgi:ferredoxin
MTHRDEHWLPRINLDLCTGCGDCIAGCPTGALGWQRSKAAVVYPELCTYCGNCEDICPVGAVELPYLIVNRGFNEGEQS